jgi:glucose-1-phosphate cytidylyltransferase
MISVGHQPILWHIMQYYSKYGHRDFILCLGYKANVIKEYFLNFNPSIYGNFAISGFGKNFEILGNSPPDWRITLIDTGVHRNIGERLYAVKHLVQDEEYFLANYSDGLTDAPLPAMIDRLKESGKACCFLAVHPPFSFHLVDVDGKDSVLGFRSSQEANIWINGGFFVFSNRIFDYMRKGEELVLEPFMRMIKAQDLLAYKHEGFWRAMDTLRDKQMLEDMVEDGSMPWCAGPI